jgi:hypothetical protein
MDEFDRASELEERTRQLEIAAALAVPKLKATHFCHYCYEPVNSGLLFCDTGCRDDYEKEARHKRINGR